MKSLVSALLAGSVLATAAGAQNLAGSFSPNPAPIGQQITFTLTDSTGGGLNLSSPCTWYSIRQGSQTGPIVPAGGGCIAVIVPVAPNGTYPFSWDQKDGSTGQQVPAGTYWVEAKAWDGTFSRQFTDWFCISIQSGQAPALLQTSTAKIGQTLSMTVRSVSDPGQNFFTGLSLTSNTPLVVPPATPTCLSWDPLLSASLSDPVLGAPLIGTLDAAGMNTNVSVAIPADPSLAYLGFHAQTLLSTPGGFKVTNDLSFTIQP